MPLKILSLIRVVLGDEPFDGSDWAEVSPADRDHDSRLVRFGVPQAALHARKARLKRIEEIPHPTFFGERVPHRQLPSLDVTRLQQRRPALPPKSRRGMV